MRGGVKYLRIVVIVRCLVKSFVNSKREICNISILVKTVDDDRLYAIRNPFSGQFLPNTCHHWCKRNWFNVRVVWVGPRVERVEGGSQDLRCTRFQPNSSPIRCAVLLFTNKAELPGITRTLVKQKPAMTMAS